MVVLCDCKFESADLNLIIQYYETSLLWGIICCVMWLTFIMRHCLFCVMWLYVTDLVWSCDWPSLVMWLYVTDLVWTTVKSDVRWCLTTTNSFPACRYRQHELDRYKRGYKPRLLVALVKVCWWRFIIQGIIIFLEVQHPHTHPHTHIHTLTYMINVYALIMPAYNQN